MVYFSHEKQHEKEYIDAGGGFCPNCRSDQIEGDSVDFDGPHCTQRMWCLDCHAAWFDVYTLSNVTSGETREDLECELIDGANPARRIGAGFAPD